MDDLAAAEVRKAKSYITVVDVEPAKKRFIGNLVEAAQIRGLEGLQVPPPPPRPLPPTSAHAQSESFAVECHTAFPAVANTIQENPRKQLPS